MLLILLIFTHCDLLSAIWSPYSDRILGGFHLSLTPCNHTSTYFNTSLTILDVLDFPKPVINNCDEEDGLKNLNTHIANFDAVQTQNASKERQEFEFQRIRWTCDNNITCYEEKLAILQQFYYHITGTEFATSVLSSTVDTIREDINTILLVILNAPIEEFQAYKVLKLLSTRSCTLHKKFRDRKPYKLAKKFSNFVKFYEKIVISTKKVLQEFVSLNSSQAETESKLLDSTEIFTPLDTFYNSAEFAKTIYSLYINDNFNNSLSQVQSLFEIKLLLLNTTIASQKTINDMGITDAVSLMQSELYPDSETASISLASKILEHRLSAPMKFASAGFLLAQFLLKSFLLGSNINGNSNWNDAMDCFQENFCPMCSRKDVLLIDALSLKISFNALKVDKSEVYLQTVLFPAFTKNKGLTKAQMFFFTAAMMVREKKVLYVLTQHIDSHFNCSSSFQELCKIKAELTTIKSLRKEDTSTSASDEDVSDDITVQTPLQHSPTTSTVPTTTLPLHTLWTTDHLTTVTLPRKTIKPKLPKSIAYHIPNKQSSGLLTVNLNITVLSNNGTITINLPGN